MYIEVDSAEFSKIRDLLPVDGNLIDCQGGYEYDYVCECDEKSHKLITLVLGRNSEIKGNVVDVISKLRFTKVFYIADDQSKRDIIDIMIEEIKSQYVYNG